MQMANGAVCTLMVGLIPADPAFAAAAVLRADGRGGAGHDLERQGIVPGLAAEIHRVDAEQCEAGHDRCRLVEISAERCR